MYRHLTLRKAFGSLALGTALLVASPAFAEGDPPLSAQLNDLGRQALAQGRSQEAKTFFQKALQLNPADVDAQRGLDATVHRVALQEPAPAPAPAPAPDPDPAPAPAADPVYAPTAPAPASTPAANVDAKATLENAAQLEDVQRQLLTDDVRHRLQEAKTLVDSGQPESALTVLRLVQTVIRSADQVDEATRTTLDRQVQAQYLTTVRAEERIVSERAERLRREAAAEQQLRTVDQLARNQDTINAMMIQFDALMAQGIYNVLYNGGSGDIVAATLPFSDARLLAQQARALNRDNVTPYAGMFVSQTMGFLAQEMAYELLKEYRYMLTMQDVARAAVPFPDGKVIEYPDADVWRAKSEKRIKRYGRAVDLLDRDPKTKGILAKLDEPISMNFANETPLEDVLKYIKQATQGPSDSGIPIYVDPVGLQEAEKTMTSPITLDLEGVPLKTTLRLLLKQLGLTYTVKDGLLTITSISSEDQPTEIRVYPVADLAIIPISLMMGGGGGMGGMGGGMGGMGGGMGGMGGGMGGMGGGMGGMGGGMMGGMGGMGMMSVPVQSASH